VKIKNQDAGKKNKEPRCQDPKKKYKVSKSKERIHKRKIQKGLQ